MIQICVKRGDGFIIELPRLDQEIFRDEAEKDQNNLRCKTKMQA